jgi:P-type Cu+ transporter
MTNDPVCGVAVDENIAATRIDYRGETYYFCSSGRQKRFVAQPTTYSQSADSHHGRAGSDRHKR